MNDHTDLESTVRDALHDAADHAPLVAEVPLADAPVAVNSVRATRRPRALVAAGAIAVGVALIVGVLVATRDGSTGIRIAAPTAADREVPLEQLRPANGAFEVFMQSWATDEQIAAVRGELDMSPDVLHYAYVDHQAAYTEFARIFACNQDLVSTIQPSDLPISFRVLPATPEGAERLRATLDALPGVDSVASASQTDEEDQNTAREVCAPNPETSAPPPSMLPSTVPPTLPAAGEQPADTSAARDAVVAAFTQAWNGASSIEQRRAAMQASDELAAVLDQARAGNEALIPTMHAVVGDVTFVAPDRAAVVFHLELEGTVEPTQVGYAVLDGDHWKVSRETVCDVLRLAAVSCPGG